MAKRIGPSIAAAAILPLLLPEALFAWSDRGHEAVAMVAEDRLSDAAKAKISAILGPGVTLEGIAPCADLIRGDLAEDPEDDSVVSRAVDHSKHTVRCGGITWKEDGKSRLWHFIKIPITDSPRDDAGLRPYCRGSDCVVDQIKLSTGALADPSASRADKQVALMYLVHFMGDLHQPMHCATDAVDGADERAGGAQTTKLGRALLKLHDFWDHLLQPQDGADDPASLVHGTLEPEIAAAGPAALASWTAGDFVVAAGFESFHIAQGSIYPRFYGGDAENNLDADRKTANERLEKAGVRLAAYLEAALGEPKPGGAANPAAAPIIEATPTEAAPVEDELDW